MSALVNAEIWVLGAASMLLSALLTEWVRRVALARGILDSPNARSSHLRPTPRGGGIAIVIGSLAGMLVLAWLGWIETRLFYALAGGGAAVALAGHLDDLGRIGIAGRFTVHIAAAIWATAWLGGITEIHWGEGVIRLGYLGSLLAVLGIVWALNLFNFMDGIDGIAASQAIFMSGAGAVFAILAGMSNSTPAAGLVLAASSLGFLAWNWPPARIFMGDVGSGYLGFALAVIGLAAMRERAVMLQMWLILGGVFFIDSTVTLLRRLARHERVYEAHRSHAYQWQARRWNSHLRVTIACLLINLLWLAPWAWLSVRFPALGGWFVVAAWIPLIVLAAACGSGRREVRGEAPGQAG
jgi:Fuc2NAc and GlcNAc transferase